MKRILKKWLYTERPSTLQALFIVSVFSAILSLLPIFYTWGKFNIGGDILIPLGSEGLEKFLYHWIAIADGQYYAINYYPYYLLYKAFEFLHLSVYQISSVLLFVLGLIAGIGIYKICSLFYESKSPYVYFAPISFYLFSPALLNGWHYNFIYAFIPWFIYFVFKAVKQNKIQLADVVLINVVLFFCSMDLPNPKYVFHLYFIALLIFLGALALRLIDVSFFKLNWKKLVIHVLLTSYILIPTVSFVTQYSSEKYGVKVKAGYQSTGQMGDYGSANMETMLKLHNVNVYLNSKDAARYNKNPAVSFLSYLFLFIITLVLLRDKSGSKKEYVLILFGLLVMYIFLAVGPNPPLGFIYEYLVTTFPLLAFLRTTAGAVFYLSLFYTILLFIFLANLRRHKIKTTMLVLAALSVVSYPLINGEYFKNFNGNRYADTEQRGYKIPDSYFHVKDTLDSLRLDAKIYYPNSDLTYLNTKWGFFGPVIYNFIYKNSNIGFNKVNGNPAIHNVGFIYKDNSLFGQEGPDFIKSTLIIRDRFIKISRTSREEFLPHFYAPTKLISYDEPEQVLAECVTSQCRFLGTAVVTPSNIPSINFAALNLTNTPHLEFRKIDPTKYRIRIHGARKLMPLVFSENFHFGWKIYAGRMWNSEDTKISLSDYKILDGNKEDQATIEELKDYLHRGLITSLGDGNEKAFQHKKWWQEREIPSYSEKYIISFISKNFKNTIQNDNLPMGHIYETWFKKQIPEATHFIANSYANGWMVDVEKLCAKSQICRRNDDGTFDMELVVEFWPQRIYYFGITISGLTLLFSVAFLLWQRRKTGNPVGISS